MLQLSPVNKPALDDVEQSQPPEGALWLIAAVGQLGLFDVVERGLVHW